jgi:hypothetical protein
MDFNEKLLGKKFHAPPDIGNGAPKLEELPNPQLPDGLPNSPLKLEEMEQMDEEMCLMHIQERHHISRDKLFTHIPNDEHINTAWDSGYLAKLALMRLEGVSNSKASDFFSHELSLLRKSESTISLGNISVITSNHFSEELKGRILLVTGVPRWRIEADLDDRSLIEKIVAKTGLKRDELFVDQAKNRNIPGFLNIESSKKYKIDDILKAFLMRLEDVPYDEIFSRLGIVKDKKNLQNLKAQISQKFSKKARQTLPRNRDKIETDF